MRKSMILSLILVMLVTLLVVSVTASAKRTLESVPLGQQNRDNVNEWTVGESTETAIDDEVTLDEDVHLINLDTTVDVVEMQIIKVNPVIIIIEPAPLEQSTVNSTDVNETENGAGEGGVSEPVEEGGEQDQATSDATEEQGEAIEPAGENSTQLDEEASVSQSPTEETDENGTSEEPLPMETKATTNEAPTLQIEIPDYIVYEDSSLSIDISPFFSDDSSIVTEMSFAVASNPASDIAYIDGYSLIIDGGRSPDWSGELALTVRATDEEGLYVDSNDFTVHIEPVNDAPISKGISILPMYQGSTLELALDNYFSDSDSDLEYGISGARYLAVEIRGAIASITAPCDWYGTEKLLFSASDLEYTVIEELTITVQFAPTFRPLGDDPMVIEPGKTEAIDVSEYLMPGTEIDDVTVTSGNENIDVRVDPETNEITLTPKKGWSGEELVTVHVVSDSGNVYNIQIPVLVAEGTRPLKAWLFSYVMGVTFAGVFVGSRFTMERMDHRKRRSPVRLESYRYFRGT